MTLYTNPTYLQPSRRSIAAMVDRLQLAHPPELSFSDWKLAVSSHSWNEDQCWLLPKAFLRCGFAPPHVVSALTRQLTQAEVSPYEVIGLHIPSDESPIHGRVLTEIQYCAPESAPREATSLDDLRQNLNKWGNYNVRFTALESDSLVTELPPEGVERDIWQAVYTDRANQAILAGAWSAIADYVIWGKAEARKQMDALEEELDDKGINELSSRITAPCERLFLVTHFLTQLRILGQVKLLSLSASPEEAMHWLYGPESPVCSGLQESQLSSALQYCMPVSEIPDWLAPIRVVGK